MDIIKIRANLASNTKHIREKLKMNQTEFGKKVGTTRAGIGSIEECRAINLSTIVQIAALANITLDEMITTKIKIDGKQNKV